jgi:hypothetical protein
MPTIMLASSDPAIPGRAPRTSVVYLSVAWSGSPKAGERALAPLRAIGSPIADTVVSKSYTDLFSPVDRDEVSSWGVSSRALFLESLDDHTIEVIERRLTEPGAPGAIAQLRVLGGAMARVPGDATAFGWRDRAAVLWLITPYEELDRAADHEAWTAAFRAELPIPDAATYVNFMGTEGADAVRGAYPAPTFARLRELKRRYDPDNLFRGTTSTGVTLGWLLTCEASSVRARQRVPAAEVRQTAGRCPNFRPDRRGLVMRKQAAGPCGHHPPRCERRCRERPARSVPPRRVQPGAEFEPRPATASMIAAPALPRRSEKTPPPGHLRRLDCGLGSDRSALGRGRCAPRSAHAMRHRPAGPRSASNRRCP